MTELGEAFVPIRATLDKLDGDLAGAKGKIEKALGGLSDGLKSVGTVALGLGAAGFTALAAGIGIALSEAMDAQAIMAQTEAVIKSTGGAAGMTAKQIGDLATALSTQSRFSDDAIQTGENLLLTFTNIGQDTFPAATQAMVDMAAAMGTDVSGGAIQLGKALNDPVAGISALSRVGVTFTEDQKKVIKSLVATGDVAGAQAVILAELTKEFGGSAAAAADTFAGKMDVVKNQLLNVAEGLGMVLLPVLTNLIDGVMTPAIPIIQAIADAFGVVFADIASGDVGVAFDDLREGIFGIGQQLGFSKEELVAFNTSLTDAWNVITGSVIPAIQELVAQVTPYLQQAGEWLAQNVQLQDVLIALGVAIAAVVIPAIASVVAAAAPVIIAFVAVIAIAALLRQAWEEDWGGIQEKTAAVVAWLRTTISAVLTDIQAWWAENGDAILAKAQEIWNTIQTTIAAAVSSVRAYAQSALADIQAFWATNGATILANAQATYTAILERIQTAVGQVRAFIQSALAGIQAFWAAHGENVMVIVKALMDLIGTIIKAALVVVGAIIFVALKAIQIFWDAWGGTIIAVVTNMGESLGFVIDAIAHAIKGDWKAFGEDLGKIFANAWENIKLLLNNALKIFTEIDWGGIGRAIMEGIGNGIAAYAHFMTDAARAAAQAAFDAAKSVLGIHSPSTVFEGVGENMMQGMAKGIQENLSMPAFALGKLLPVMGLLGEDAGPTSSSTHYNPVTTIYTNADPMRSLRAARHLDKLGSLP